jgi:hypothetical protein
MQYATKKAVLRAITHSQRQLLDALSDIQGATPRNASLEAQCLELVEQTLAFELRMQAYCTGL